jgi:hypothetical protein
MQSTLSPFQKSIHLLLILYAGIIGPLSYFNFYSPHRVANSFHLSILEDPALINELAVLKKSLNQSKPATRISQMLNPGPAVSDPLFTHNYNQNLQDVLGYLYAAAGIHTGLQQRIFGLKPSPDPILKSADLPPLDKPPTF